jgi:hypothetical protein
METDLLWATGLLTVVVMPDGILVPPLPHPIVPHTQSTVQQKKETNSKTTWCRISCRATSTS